jgi:chromosome partitioning protein
LEGGIVKTVALFTQKGGAGKSTLAIHIAVAASASHHVLLVDADPQGTVTAWGALRSAPLPFVAKVDPSTIQTLLCAARDEGYTLVILDCPPHAVAGTAALLAVADHIVIPCQPTMPDLAATQRAVLLASASGKPFSLVINRAPARAPEVFQALQALQSAGLVSPVTIGDRRAFSRALTDSLAVTEFGREDGKAALEVVRYWTWLDQHMQMEDTTWQLEAA